MVGDGVPSGGDARIGEACDDIGGQTGRDGSHECFRGPAGIEFVARPVRARPDHGGLMVVARNGQHGTGQPRHPGDRCVLGECPP